MNKNCNVTLEDAKCQLAKLMSCFNETDRENLISFITQERHCNANSNDVINLWDGTEGDISYDPVDKLNSIVKYIKGRVTFEATSPSEKIICPKTGQNSDCDPNITLNVDAFLYTDEDVNKLVESERLNLYYCGGCGSRNIKRLICVSHSTSRDTLHFIFTRLLPTLKGKTVLDVGSRLGAVLYGAYVYTDAERIIGVEMNSELCNLQNDVVYRYKMQDRIEISHKRIENAAEVIGLADVIILNNPFEFYLTETEQVDAWQFLKAAIKRGTIIVTNPPIKTMFKNLNTKIKINEWLKQLDLPNEYNCSLSQFDTDIDDFSDEHLNVACYEVL